MITVSKLQFHTHTHTHIDTRTDLRISIYLRTCYSPGVALTDPRWRIPFNGKIESIEVCVASSPVDIEIQIWELVDLNFGQLKMLDYYVFTGKYLDVGEGNRYGGVLYNNQSFYDYQ